MDRARRRRRGVEGRLLVFCVTPTLVVVPCVINLKRPGCFRGFVTRPCPAREGSPLLIGPVEHAGIRGAGEEALADVDRDAIETAFISFAADKQRHYQSSAGGLATARALAMKRRATGVNVRSLQVMSVTGQRWRSAPFAREPVSCRLEGWVGAARRYEVGAEREIPIPDAAAKSCSAAGDEHALRFQKVFFEHHCAPKLANTVISQHHGCTNWGSSCVR